MPLPLPSHQYSFNEAAGTALAYDGAGEVSLSISGGNRTTGRVERALRFGGSGSLKTEDPLIDFSDDFSYAAWYRADHFITRVVAFLRYTDGQELSVEAPERLAEWTHLAIVRTGVDLSLFVNGRIVSYATAPEAWGDPVGLALISHDAYNDAGHCSIDDARIYNGYALTAPDLTQLITMAVEPVKSIYLLNGINFKSYGVYVSKGENLLDNLDRKDPFSVEWEDYHGQIVDLTTPVYQVREIILNCFVVGSGKSDFTAKVRDFIKAIDKKGTQRLTWLIGSDSPRPYEVYLKENIDLDYALHEGQTVGTFTLKLIEPQPVKRVLRFSFSEGQSAQVTITLTSKKLLTAFWGDGLKSNNIYGTALTITHTYVQPGEYVIVLAGNIEQVTGFSTNAEMVWSEL